MGGVERGISLVAEWKQQKKKERKKKETLVAS